MTPNELADRVTARYPDAQRIADNVMRLTRRAGSRPFAVYYLDCNSNIPASLDELRSYQDRIIGRRYFDGPPSLQWNNYIYFVTNDDRLNAPEIGQIRELLEQDRTYARKFLIGETELDHVLQPDVVKGDPTTETNVLSVWNNQLAQAGLGRAIWADLDMPRRLALLESTAPTRSSSLPAPPSTVGPGQRLSRLTLTRYREYPLIRDFAFGTVNLVVGPNASGKTSLLEAIELFYCGRNKRSPDARPDYDLSATLEDGTPEHATDARPPKFFRQRNLSWYGQLEVKTNDLYSSFARFNFLDTDAAVHLADEVRSIEEDLSRLLIGPDAAKTWDNMAKVHEQARVRLKNLRDEDRSLQQQIVDIDALLQTLTDESGSDLIRHRLLNLLRQRTWRAATPESSADLAGRLVGPLSELVALAHQAAQLPLSPMPSRGALARFIKTATTAQDKATHDIAALRALELQINVATTSLARAREASDILDRAKRLLAAGLPHRVAARDSLRQDVARLSSQLAGIDSAAVESAAAAYPADTVSTHLAGARQARAESARALETVRSQHANLQVTRTRSANLADELRSIARQYLRETADESECPLCHTRFKPGELIAHIDRELTKELDRSDEELAVRLSAADAAAGLAAGEEARAAAAAAFAQRAELAPDITLAAIVDVLAKATASLAERSLQLRAIETELQTLERQGLRWADLDPLRVELVRRRFPPRDWSDDAVAETAETIAKTIGEQDKALADHTRNAEKLTQQISAALGATISNTQEARLALANLEQRNASAESLANKLAALDEQFRIPMNKTLGELAVEAEVVRQVAIELQTAVQQEKDNSTLRVQTAAKRIQLLQDAQKLAPRIKNLAAATNVLQRLIRGHSLNDAVAEAIRQNRTAIESIFAQIHAPHEFLGLGDEITELRRRGGTVSNLAEISTGQRAAVGLSIFLAQNMKLRYGPPIILIDDPIAHVDDLNCLAFLDYLREIALSQRRQIFFSTANDKLAAIFERKFDFLGPPDFRKIELHRETPAPGATRH